VASVNTITEADRGPFARPRNNALLEAARAGWATTLRLAFLLVVRGAVWAGIAYMFSGSGLDTLV
jgi:hypothetical protein